MAKRLKLPEAIAALAKIHGEPRTAPRPADPLLDHLLVGVLSAESDLDRASRCVRAVSESFLDLNEARVSPLNELVAVLEPILGEKAKAAALHFRTALQDVFDGTHGLDLEPLRGRDPDDLRKFLKELPHSLGGPASAVLQLALGDAHLAVSAAEQRVLSRLGVLPRSQEFKKVRLALERAVKPVDRLQFSWAVGSHASAVCWPKVPHCEACSLLPNCPFGEQEMKQRAIDRKKEEHRRAQEEKRRKETEARQARIAARLAASAAKKKAAEEAKAARLAAALKKKAEAKAKIEAAKKAAKQKAIDDKAAAKKAAKEAAKAKADAAKAAAKAKADALKAAAKAKADAAKAAAKADAAKAAAKADAAKQKKVAKK